MSYLDVLRSDYFQKVPSQILLKSVQGFAASAAISLVCGVTLPGAIVAGAMSAVATLVEAVTRPFFQILFPEYSYIAHTFHLFFSSVSGASIVSALSPLFGYRSHGNERLGESFLLGTVLSWLSWIAFNDAEWYPGNRAVSML